MGAAARSAGAGLLVGLLLLAGCGVRAEVGASGGAASSPAPTAPRPTTGDRDAPAGAAPDRQPEELEDAERLADLAELAEQAAGAGSGQGARQDTTAPAPRRSGPVLGADMGWPQCPPGLGIPERRTLGKPLPLPAAEYVVVGLTNGPGFTPNPCLAEQVAWVRERRLMAAAYAVASYPDADAVARHGTTGPYRSGSRLDALRNTGYQQALFNVASMREAGLRTPVVWVDVEPVADFEWSGDPVANAAVVEGVARGYVDAGYRIGVYSTPYLWSEIVGGFRLGVPEWRAAGQTSRTEALARCGEEWSIQGGAAVLGQWVEADRDQNVTCPGVHRDLGAWFHQY